MAGKLSQRHVGDWGVAEREQRADFRVGRDLAAPDGVGQEQGGKGLGERADLVLSVFIHAEVGVGDGRAVDHGDADVVERPVQQRPRSGSQRGIAGHNRGE